MTSEVRELLQPSVRVAWILWGAMTASIWMYVAVAFVLAPPEGGEAALPSLPWLLGGLSVAVGGASLVVPRVLLSDDRLRAAVESAPEPEALARDPQSGTVDPERLRRIRELPDAQRKLLGLGGALLVPTIVPLAMNEAIALFGLVLVFLGEGFEVILPFAIAATVLNLVARPPVDAALERASRLVR